MAAPAPHRICLSTVSYPPERGGVSVASSRLARTLAVAGYDVDVVTSVARAGARGEVEHAVEDGVRVHRVLHETPHGLRGFVAHRQALVDLDRTQPFSLFHGFFLTAAAPCADLAARGSRPLVASIRGSDAALLLDQPATRALLAGVLRHAAWITSVSDEALARVAKEVPVDGRCSIIRNSVETPGAGEQWRRSPERRGVVGTVGEFRKAKDIPLLIRAYAAVPANARRRLVLSGYFTDTEEREWSEVLVDELGLTGETTVTGPFSHADIDAQLSSFDVFVQSSAHEGMSNALLEAAARGIPIVATAVGAARELLVDGESALLVPHGDRDALARAIRRALEDDHLAVRLSRGARAMAETLTPEGEREAWLALYRRLIDGPSVA